MWTSRRLSPADLIRFYALDYRALYCGHDEASEGFYAEQIEHGQAIFAFVAAVMKEPGVVFDIGCGAGGAVKVFHDAGWKAFGCDFDKQYLERGRRDGLLLREGDVHALKHDAPADLMLFNHVVEHLDDPVHYMREVLQYLKPGGWVYIAVPGIYDMKQEYGQFERFLQNAHLQHYHLALLNHVMAKCGLRFEKGDQRIRALYRYEPTQASGDWLSRNYPRYTQRYLKAMRWYSAYNRSWNGLERFVRRTRGMTRLSRTCAALPGLPRLAKKLGRWMARTSEFEDLESAIQAEAESVRVSRTET